MKTFRWSEEKNDLLKHERDISFEEIVVIISENGLLDIREHPNQARYPHQRIFVIALNGYVYLVPFVETDKEVFLKTIIPSRKATKRYLIK